MDSFRRYARTCFATLDHPFTAERIPLAPSELDEAIGFATQVLVLPIKEHRLANLEVLFDAAFGQYLVVSRDQPGALINAAERLASLLEPYLKKLVYLCYPRRTLGQNNKPLWHFGVEQIIHELALASADLGKNEDSYWRQQPLEDANWRIAFVSRHKGVHEAHEYDLPQLERIVKAILSCYLLAALKALADPGSRSQAIQESTRVQELNELLTARAQTYRLTHDLPDALEHLRFYECRAALSLSEEKSKLLFAGHLAGNGPVFAFLQSIPLSTQVLWARELLASGDDSTAMAAVEFLYSAGEALRLDEVADLFRDYKHRYKLAFYIDALATGRDLPLLWKLHRHKATIVRRAVIRSIVKNISERRTRFLWKAMTSASAATKELALTLGVELATPEKLDAYRQALNGKDAVRMRYGLLALGKVGSTEDIPRLEELLDRKRLDRRTREAAAAGLSLLASRVIDERKIKQLLRDRRRYLVRAVLLGLKSSQCAIPIREVVRLYRWFPREVGDLLERCVTKKDRGEVHLLLKRVPLDESAKRVALALCSIASPADVRFLVRLIANAHRHVDFREQYDLIFALSRKVTGRKLRPFFRRFIQAREFWSYYGADRPQDKMPVSNHENIPLVRRIVGLCFGESAMRKDLPLLLRMLEHSYWSVQRGAVNALARLGALKELERLIHLALRRAEEMGDIDGLLDAVQVLDRKLFGNLPRETPKEAAFGGIRGSI
jgi:hypothetical protein